jgi:hypothetical protein
MELSEQQRNRRYYSIVNSSRQISVRENHTNDHESMKKRKILQPEMECKRQKKLPHNTTDQILPPEIEGKKQKILPESKKPEPSLFLRRWTDGFDINHNAVKDLITYLRTFPEFSHLPVETRTLIYFNSDS